MSIKSAFNYVGKCERVSIVFIGMGVWLKGHNPGKPGEKWARIGEREKPWFKLNRSERLKWADKVIKEIKE